MDKKSNATSKKRSFPYADYEGKHGEPFVQRSRKRIRADNWLPKREQHKDHNYSSSPWNDVFLDSSDYELKQIDTSDIVAGVSRYDRRVEQIFIAEDLLFVVWGHGLCAVFAQGGCRRVCQFRGVHAVVYNPYTRSVIAVLGYRANWRDTTLTLREIPIESIKKGTPFIRGKNLFPSESDIKHCDFDIQHCRGMIYVSNENVFKVFDLQNYEHLYTILNQTRDPTEFTFQSSGNEEMVMFNETRPYSSASLVVHLTLFSKRTGHVQRRKDVSLRRKRATLVGVTLCGDKAILQTENFDNIHGVAAAPLRVVDLQEEYFYDYDIKAGEANDQSPIYLPGTRWLVAPLDDHSELKIGIWDLANGRTGTPRRNSSPAKLLVLQQHDRTKQHIECGPLVAITDDQDTIVAYHRVLDHNRNSVDMIHVADIYSQKVIGRIVSSPRVRTEGSVIECFWYDHRSRQVFAGNRQGELFRWTPRLSEDYEFMDVC